MRPQTPISDTLKKKLHLLLSETEKKSDFQRVQCVWLRAEFGMDGPMVAKITGLKEGTIRKIWSTFLKKGEKSLFVKNRGGRRNSHLSMQEEKLLLAPFFKSSGHDSILIVAEIKATYEELIGKKVPKSTIYRLLARHGWKKKIGRTYPEERNKDQSAGIHEYWIDGCTQALAPERNSNISQNWLNTTLNSMVKKDRNEI